MNLHSCFKISRFHIRIFFAAVFLSALAPVPSAPAGGLPEEPAVVAAYKLGVEDRSLTERTLKDLIELLGGTSRSTVMKDSRPPAIRLRVILPPEQSDYFLSKLSGLGELTSPSSDLSKERGSGDVSARRISIDIFDQ
jgi:hypothetical protein